MTEIHFLTFRTLSKYSKLKKILIVAEFFYWFFYSKSYAPKCEKKVVPFDDVVKIVKIIFQKFPSICISRMKVCGAYPKPTNPYTPSTHNPYSKPTYPQKPSNPYHVSTYIKPAVKIEICLKTREKFEYENMYVFFSNIIVQTQT